MNETQILYTTNTHFGMRFKVHLLTIRWLYPNLFKGVNPTLQEAQEKLALMLKRFARHQGEAVVAALDNIVWIENLQQLRFIPGFESEMRSVGIDEISIQEFTNVFVPGDEPLFSPEMKIRDVLEDLEIDQSSYEKSKDQS